MAYFDSTYFSSTYFEVEIVVVQGVSRRRRARAKEHLYFKTFRISLHITYVLDYRHNIWLWVAQPTVTKATIQATIAHRYGISKIVTTTVQQEYLIKAPIIVGVAWPYMTRQLLKGKIRDDADDYLLYAMILNLID